MRVRGNPYSFLMALAAVPVVAIGLVQTTVGQGPSSSSQSESSAKSSASTATLKTGWGAPDLQGTWSNVSVVPFERPKQYGERQFLTDAEHQKAVDVLLKRDEQPGRDSRSSQGKDIRGTEKDVARAYNEHWFGDKPTQVSYRTSQIIDPPDGRMPAYTSDALARINKQKEYLEALLQGTSGGKPGPISPLRYQQPPDYNLDRMNRADGPEDRSAEERCFLDRLPVVIGPGPLTPDGRPVGNFSGVMRIVESPDSVDFYYDVGQGSGFNRAVPISNRPHLPKDVRQYWGDSIAHWDGDTLVVDVTNFTHESDFRGSRENLHLIERYQRVNAQTLRITITAEDPTTWVKPFTFVQELTKNADKPNMVYEGGCHEGNQALLDMLVNTRAAEKLFSEGKGPDPALEDNASGGNLVPE
jgi:hypothetical protein